MQLKYELIIAGGIIIISFTSGRYSVAPPNVKTQDVKTTTTQEQTQQEKHIVTVVTKDCKTGKEITTITEDDSIRQREAQQTIDKLLQTVTQQQRSTMSVSGLAGLDFHTMQPAYGISLEKDLVGPLFLGVQGLGSSTSGLTFVGASVGLHF